MLTCYQEAEILYDCVFGGSCEEFVKQYWRLVFNTVRKTFTICRVPHTIQDVEDMTIEVFIKLFENNKRRLWQYNEKKSSLACWIIMIANRTVLNYIRDVISKQRNEESFTEDRCGITDQLSEKRNELIINAVKMQSKRDQLIIKITYFDGLTAEECARILGISVNAFYKAKHDAIKRLRNGF